MEHKLRYTSFLSCAVRMKKPLGVQIEGWPYICHIFVLRKGFRFLKPGRGGIYVLTSKTGILLSASGGFQTVSDFSCQYKSSPDILNSGHTQELFSLKRVKLPNIQFRHQLSWDPKSMFLCLSSPQAGLSALKIPTKQLWNWIFPKTQWQLSISFEIWPLESSPFLSYCSIWMGYERYSPMPHSARSELIPPVIHSSQETSSPWKSVWDFLTPSHRKGVVISIRTLI